MTNGGQTVFDWSKLTKKELEALEAYREHLSYKAAARALGKSIKAVEALLTSAKRKMGAASISHAMILLESRYSAAPAPVPTPRRHKWTIPALCVCGAAVLMAAYGAASRSAGVNSSLPMAQISSTSIDRLTEELRAVDTGDALSPADREIRRAAVVRALAAKAWQAMWGPSEDSVVRVFTRYREDVRRAIRWSLARQPDIAVSILGDSHRIVAKVPGFEDWPRYADRALAASRNEDIQYGRLLCGYAYAHWSDNPAAGFQAASRAYDIFRVLPGSRWDEANALRHMGLCAPNGPERAADYDRALKIYRTLGDSRGVAMCLLSQAENRWRVTHWPLRTSVTAAEMFLALRNGPLIDESLGQAQRDESVEPPGADIPARQRLRKCLLEQAENAKQWSHSEAYNNLMAGVLAVDYRMRDESLAFSDLENLLHALTDGEAYFYGGISKLYGFYSLRCEKLHKTPTPELLDRIRASTVDNPAQFKLGRTFSDVDAIDALASPNTRYVLWSGSSSR